MGTSGLDPRSGRRKIGGWSRTGDRVGRPERTTAIVLTHHRDPNAWVAVEPTLVEHEFAEESQAENLAAILDSGGTPPSVVGTDLGSWPMAAITVDHRTVKFAV